MTAKKQKQPRKISRQYLENAALYYLQRYASSAENLRRVLRRKIMRSCAFHKDVPDAFYPIADELVARYIASGLLDDKVFARSKVSSLRRQGKSAKAIHAKLQAKGLGKDDIGTALEEQDTEEEDADLAAARRLVKRKKLGQTKDAAKRQKELAVLGRAGFSYETAKAALDYAEDEE